MHRKSLHFLISHISMYRNLGRCLKYNIVYTNILPSHVKVCEAIESIWYFEVSDSVLVFNESKALVEDLL